MLGSLLRRDQGLSTIAPGSALYAALTGDGLGMGTIAGPTVNSDTALRIGAVMACVRLIAETIASLPRKVYRRTAEGREEVRAPSDRYLWGAPNDEMLGQFFWANVVAQLLLHGNAYLYTPRNELGKTSELWPLMPTRVQPVRVKPLALGDPSLLFLVDGVPYGPEDILHIPGFGTDGVKGLNPIAYARQSLGLALAQEEFGARFYGQGAALQGILTSDQKLTKEQTDRIQAQWKAAHGGRQNAHKTAILEGGLKWTATSIAPADAEFLDGRKFSRSEIASLFRVPPHLIGDVERSTSWGTGIEQQNIQFVTYTLLPWLSCIEEAVSERLLMQPDRYFKFDLRGLLRGTMKERFDAYKVAREGGWYSVNKILTLEDEPPVKGGDDLLRPLNYAPLNAPASAPTGGNNDGPPQQPS